MSTPGPAAASPALPYLDASPRGERSHRLGAAIEIPSPALAETDIAVAALAGQTP